MELGTEISQNVKTKITNQLQTLGCYVDEELPEYIMVMIANKRNREQMVEDLSPFLDTQTEKFVTWLKIILKRIENALKIAEIDSDEDSDEEEELSDEEEIKLPEKKSAKDKDSNSKKGKEKEVNKEEEEKRRSRGKEGRERSKSNSSKDNGKAQRTESSNTREASREKTDRKRRPSEDNGHNKKKEIVNESGKSEAKRQKKDPPKESRTKKSKANAKKRSSGEPSVKEKAKSKPSKNEETNGCKQKDSSNGSEVEKEIETIDVDGIDFVKEEVITSPDESSPLKTMPTESAVETAENNEDGQAAKDEDDQQRLASQDVDDILKGSDEKAIEDDIKTSSPSEDQKDKLKIQKKSKKELQGLTDEPKKSSPSEDQKEKMKIKKKSKKEPDGLSKEDHKKDKSNEKNKKKKASNSEKASQGEKEEKEEKNGTKKKVSSKVKVYTDFSRKPSLPKHDQASAVLLKRAVSEAVTKTSNDDTLTSLDLEAIPINCEEDDVSDNDEEEEEGNNLIVNRRIVNLHDSKFGLPTITVNFDKPFKQRSIPGSEGEEESFEEHHSVGNNGKQHTRILKLPMKDEREVVHKRVQMHHFENRHCTGGGTEPPVGDLRELLRRKREAKMSMNEPNASHHGFRDFGRGRNVKRSFDHMGTDYSSRTKKSIHHEPFDERDSEKRYKGEEEEEEEEEEVHTEKVNRKLAARWGEDDDEDEEDELNLSLALSGDGDGVNDENEEQKDGAETKQEFCTEEENKNEKDDQSEKITEKESVKNEGNLSQELEENVDKETKQTSGKTKSEEESTSSLKLKQNGEEPHCTPDESSHKCEKTVITDEKETPNEAEENIVDLSTSVELDLDVPDSDKVIDNSKDNIENSEKKCAATKKDGGSTPKSDGNALESRSKSPRTSISNDKDNKDQGLKKSRHHKRRKMKHEVIVTLDGLGDGKRLSLRTDGLGDGKRLSLRTQGCEANPEILLQDRVPSHRHRHRHSGHQSGRSKSDEEFEEILRRKDEEDKRRSRHKSRYSDERRRSRSTSRDRDGGERNKLTDVDREILIAEKKLSTQKLLKKSLHSIQNLQVDLPDGARCTLQTGRPRTAFINPKFQGKLPFVVQPVCTTNPVVVRPGLITDNRILAPPSNTLVLERKDPKVSSNSNNSTSSSQPAEGLNTSNSSNSSSDSVDQTVVKVKNDAPGTFLGRTEELDHIPLGDNKKVLSPIPSDLLSSKPTIQERCLFWPNCNNPCCAYVHPSVDCMMFPFCQFGPHCLYLHPPCMFGANCTNLSCQYTHSSGSAQICKYYPNCNKTDCKFEHVEKISTPCRFGPACKKPQCLYLHSEPLNSVQAVPVINGHISERKFAVDTSGVSQVPVSVVSATNDKC